MELPVNYNDTHWTERRLVRDEYIKRQEGKCCHCNALLSGEASADVLSLRVKRSIFPTNFFKWPVHLHHNHDTGMTIGAVHNYCNAVLWQYHGK